MKKLLLALLMNFVLATAANAQDANAQQRDDQPWSKFTFTIHAFRKKGRERVRVQGSLGIHWAAGGRSPTPVKIEVLQATIDTRSGPNAFQPIPEVRIRSRKAGKLREGTGPINVCDLNGDNLPDILLANANTLLLNLGNWKFDTRRLFLHYGEDDAYIVAVVADFNSDGVVDFIG